MNNRRKKAKKNAQETPIDTETHTFRHTGIP